MPTMTEATSSSSPPSEAPSVIDLTSCPSIFVVPTHLSLDALHDVEEALSRCSASLTYDINEASWILGKLTQKKRASLELRSRDIWTEEAQGEETGPPLKRRRLETSERGGQPVKETQTVDLTVPSDAEDGEEHHMVERAKKQDQIPANVQESLLKPPSSRINDSENIRVLKLDWLSESLSAGEALPPESYTVYYARKVSKPELPYSRTISSGLSSPAPKDSVPQTPSSEKRTEPTSSILDRAKAEASSSPPQRSAPQFSGFRRQKDGHERSTAQTKRPMLYRQTTSEHEEASDLPPSPDWVKRNLVYACQRSAPLHPPNEAFINQLVKVKQVRELTLDEVGVRAYSTSIAAIAAYPYPLRRPEEVLSLPGCESRIANLFLEWKHSEDGTLEAANQLEADPFLRTLNLFYNIWGVGAKTARDFYQHKQWRSLDDIVEQGWNSLSRVQQIGVKYYDEFMEGVPRADVEHIGNVVHEHAQRVRPGSEYDGRGIETVVVGGYRRGKERSGDVDIVVSHRDERVTLNLVYDIVASLEQEGWITHTLALHLTNSYREQQTLPYRGESGGKPRFDSLDKALVVWQDPHFKEPSSPSTPDPENGAFDPEQIEFAGEEEHGAGPETAGIARGDREPKGQESQEDNAQQLPASTPNRKKNPNPHRRVDIIISPWRTVGCAVLGWSGGTTFQRDLRRYAKKVHNWKFDSSGVRSRGTGGRVIDLESGGETWEEREKMVMERLGVGWRPPEERCTR